MDRARVFFDIDPTWLVHHDRSLLVVDKPEGVPTQAADPAVPDDLVTRLKRHFEATREDDYLGTHQRLDRDTSGLLLFTRRREANASIAAQFEGRTVGKRYVAAVSRWSERRKELTLDDHRVRGDEGLMVVVPSGRRGAQRARTVVRVLERRGERALLELTLVTGRTHQARVQLAHAGFAIAGDVLYGGATAPRLMLHARSLTVVHPDTKRSVAFESRVPADFALWLERGDLGEGIYDDDAALRRALARALVRRYGLARSAGPRATTAFRLVNEAGDGLPRLAIDAYAEHLVVQLYRDNDDGLDDGPWADKARRERVLDRVHELGFDGIYLKVRPRQANTLVDTRRDDLAPREPVRGTPAPVELVVLEEGMPVEVRLGDGLSTGIFLDQRANRRRIREMAASKSLLNLFSYTCGFTLAAVMGGATRTVSVDASTAALERGRQGLMRLGADLKAHTFVAEDAFAYLERAARKKETFDLVVLDPPSYSKSKKHRFVADSDYAKLAALALRVVSPGGALFASTNHRGIRRAKFRRMLLDAGRLAEIDVAQAKDLPDPSDYPTPPNVEPHLKCALVTRR